MGIIPTDFNVTLHLDQDSLVSLAVMLVIVFILVFLSQRVIKAI